MCAGNAQCKECAEKAQMGYADNILTPFGLGSLVGDKGIQTTVTVKTEVPDDFWLKMGITIVAVVLLSTFSYFGVRKILKI